MTAKKIIQINKFKLLTIALGLGLLGCHFYIYGQLLPNKRGFLGHDFSNKLAYLLEGYYFYLVNGIFAVPWFTPAFCGGVPNFPHPAGFYYSLPQLLTFFTDPLSAMRLSMMILCGLGFLGSYKLSRTNFNLPRPYAILAGALFMFNGYFVYRLVIGHIEYHGFILTPLVAYFILSHQQRHYYDRLSFWRRNGLDVWCAGLLLAYMFHSGMTQTMIPALLVILGLMLLQVIQARRNFPQFVVLGKFAAAGFLACCLSLARLTANISYLQYFKRDYLLPGIPDFDRLLMVIGRVLFWYDGHELGKNYLVNSTWLLDRHEWEYGVSVVPLLILIFVLISRRQNIMTDVLVSCKRSPFAWSGLCLIFVLPVVFNFYTKEWNEILKHTPIINSLTTLLRWFAIYIPLTIMMVLLSLASMQQTHTRSWLIAATGLILLIIWQLNIDQEYYHREEYNPQNMVNAWQTAHDKGMPPNIDQVAVYTNAEGKVVMPLHRNDLFIQGASQLACYEVMFGFRLESFPFKSLHPGQATELNNGEYNFKNPACYVYPQENACELGGHFKEQQKTELSQFLQRKPFHFSFSSTQILANWISFLTLLLFLSSGFAYLLHSLFHCLQKKSSDC